MVIKKILKVLLYVVLPILWLLFIHITTGFSNHWIDYFVNTVDEFIMKSIMIWYIAGELLKIKARKMLFVSLSTFTCLALAFLIPYLDKVCWTLKEVGLHFSSQIEIANYIYYENSIVNGHILRILFWFVFYLGISFIRCFRRKTCDAEVKINNL